MMRYPQRIANCLRYDNFTAMKGLALPVKRRAENVGKIINNGAYIERRMTSMRINRGNVRGQMVNANAVVIHQRY